MTYRIALANVRYPNTPEASVVQSLDTIAEAARHGAGIVCFPEAYVPGYRGLGYAPPPPDAAFLERAWRAVGDAAAAAGITVILGTERIVGGALRICAVVFNPDGTLAGIQDKVQLDPSEDGTYSPGSERHLFHAGPLTFGIAICHEGWRYPETVRWPARRGAHVVFHPHFHPHEEGAYVPTRFLDPSNTFHEKAMLCRAAENTCFFASVNYATLGSGTTSAVICPDGTSLAWQPYGEEGLLVCDVDLSAATGLLAGRLRPAQGQYVPMDESTAKR